MDEAIFQIDETGGLVIYSAPQPSVLLPLLAIAFAAFCVWLGVRVVNRKERWAKLTLAGVVFGLPVLYVLSFGPACWINSRTGMGDQAIGAIYRPIGWFSIHGGDAIGDMIAAWANLGVNDERRFYGVTDSGPIWLSDLWSMSGTFLRDPGPPLMEPGQQEPE